MGGAVFPPCCLTWDQTMVEVMKKMATSFKCSLTHTAALSSPDPAAGQRLLDTHRQVWVSLFRGYCSFSWVLVCTKFCLCRVSCESSGGCTVGLMATSSKRACRLPRSAAPRAPATAAGPWRSKTPQETLKHSKAGLVQSLWGLLVCTRFCLSLPSISGGLEFDCTRDFTPPTILLVLLLCPWTWGIFFWWNPTFSCWWLFKSEL